VSSGNLSGRPLLKTSFGTTRYEVREDFFTNDDSSNKLYALRVCEDGILIYLSQSGHYKPSRRLFKARRFGDWMCLHLQARLIHIGYKNPVRTSQETHYVSATEHNRLMLCKTWGFHGGDNEQCRLLGYKNPAPTSQEKHYVSATEPSRLMLCKIWGFHGDDYERCRLMWCEVVWLL
jgi:hypothetical protein